MVLLIKLRLSTATNKNKKRIIFYMFTSVLLKNLFTFCKNKAKYFHCLYHYTYTFEIYIYIFIYVILFLILNKKEMKTFCRNIYKLYIFIYLFIFL